MEPLHKIHILFRSEKMKRVNTHLSRSIEKEVKTIANRKKSLILGTLAFGGALTFGITSASADTYTVKSGDTLNKIAQKYSTTAEKIASDNNIENINLIYVDDALKINEDLPSTSTEKNVAVTVTEAPVQQSTPTSTPTNDSSAKEWIAQRESSGSYTAQNGQFVGRYQLTNTYLHGDYSPANQEKVADEYVTNRYGSWDNAKAHWLTNGWY